MKETIAIGLMSGSSLDGLDIALVRFQEVDCKYHFQILQAETLPYPEYWTKQLSEAFHKQPEDLVQLDKDYGKYLGEQAPSISTGCNALMVSLIGMESCCISMPLIRFVSTFHFG